MYHVALIEDERQDRETIASFADRYAIENGCVFRISQFNNAITFLTNYNPVYDMVFIDIQMPHMNGMDAAKKLRESDTAVPIVFITNMSNFAVNGYSVDATDFVVKPVTYLNFAVMMKKVLRICERRAKEIIIKAPDGVKRLKANEIYFVEIIDHKIIYHTEKGDIEIWGTLKAEEGKLTPCGFARCNNYCLVNLKYVDRITGTFLTIKDNKITITRARKKEFMAKLVEFYGSNF